MSDQDSTKHDEEYPENVETDSVAESSSIDEMNLSVDLELQNESICESSGECDIPSRTNSVNDRTDSSQPKSSLTSASNHMEHGAILKQLVLKGLTSQLVTAQFRLKSLEATCATVLTWIGIGTKSGLVLVFDASQNLKWFLNTIDVLGTKNSSSIVSDEWSAAVSALAFNCDHARLLVGNARGNILEYDMKDGNLLRTLNDVHPPEAAILQLKFTDIPTLALLCDSGGNVFEMSFKRTLGVKGVDTRCIFSGSRGEVCVMEPLNRIGLESRATHALNSRWDTVTVIAMATLSKLLVVQIRPSTKVIHTQTLDGDGRSPPCLGWHFVSIQTSIDGKTINPVLACGRNRELYFFQLVFNERDKLRCVALLRFRLDFSLRGLEWLDGRMLALLDSKKQIHVVDVKCRETVDIVDVSSVDLVSSAPFFQGLATGGNVSQALALVGMEACYNSFISCGNQVLLLCISSVKSIGVRNWDERLDLFVSQSKYEDAICLGLLMFDGKARAMQGLKGNSLQRKMSIKAKIITIINKFIEKTLVPLLTENYDSSRLKEVIELGINVCIKLDESSILFDEIYAIVSNHKPGRKYFLESLEYQFKNGLLPIVPPSIIQQFISHYEDMGQFDVLEECISQVDVSCLDLHQVLTLAQNQGLHHTMLYVYTQALNDYITPMEELIKTLQAAIRIGQPYPEQDVRLGHTLLVYISCCLAGRAYPFGEIPDDLKAKVKHQMLTCLTCLHSKRALEDEPPYPYMRTLLEFNTQELLNALSLAFEEAEFTGEMGSRRQQRVIDILVEIMIHSAQFSSDQICSLFTFIARQISRHRDNAIHLDRSLFLQLLDLVCTQSSNEMQVQSRFEERQQALLLLLQIKGQPLLDFKDEEKLLVQARSAKFFRVCEYLYTLREDWEQVLDCYVNDASRHSQIFQLLVDIFEKLSSSPKRIKDFECAVLSHIQFLIGLNVVDLVVFLATHKPHLIIKTVEALEKHPQLEFVYLEAVIDLVNQDNLALKTQVDSHLVERFVELMAQFQPERVASYIDMMDGDNIPKLLEICQKYSLAEASSLLLERQGDVPAAYDLLLKNLQDHIRQLFQVPDTQCDGSKNWTLFHSASQSVINLCQRQSISMVEEDRERIWLTLLDALLQPQRSVRENQPSNIDSILTVLREETQRVVTSVQGQVSLTKILPRLLQDPKTTGSMLGDLRQLIMGLLENYNYETTLLRISTHLLQGDVHGLLAQRYCSSKRAISLRTSQCSLCKNFFHSHHQKQSRVIVAFQCRHVFHKSCLTTDSKLCVVCNDIPISIVKADDAYESETEHTNLSSTQIESITKLRKMLSPRLSHDEVDASSSNGDPFQLTLPQF